MIRKVKFNNFYSFKGEQEINFQAAKKKSYSFYSSSSGSQITKIAGFIGANASGKTNVIRLLSFLSYFVTTSSKENSAENHNTAFKTFFNNEKKSSFYIEFEEDGKIFYYNFSIKGNTILKEKLELRRMKKYAHKKTIFSRSKDEIVDFSNTYLGGFKKSFLKNIRSDISLIAFLKAHYDIDIINLVFRYFSEFKTNINEKGLINNVPHQVGVLNLYLDNPEMKNRMEEFVSRFDLGLEGFEIDKRQETEGFKITVEGKHLGIENNSKLPFNYESHGTQSLFFTLANLFYALENQSVVIVDEIESGLHPEALDKLISYFIDENADGTAQLFFSSHSYGFLNILDMHQIYLAEKNDLSESNVFRLNEIDNIRSDENYLTKYSSGAYGAYPRIRV